MRLETKRVIMMYVVYYIHTVYTLNVIYTHSNLIRICCCLFNRMWMDEVILLISDRKNNIRAQKKNSFTFIYVEIEETQREIDVCLNRKYCVKLI